MTETQPALARGQLQDAEPVDLAEFCSRENDDIGEYIHANWDLENRRVALFRSVGMPGDGNWIRVDLDVHVKFSNVETEPYGVYLTGGNAYNFLLFLDRLRVEQSPYRLKIRYWGQNNSNMVDESDLDQETVIFAYQTESGRANRLTLHTLYRNEIHMMGKHDDLPFNA